MPSSGPAEGGPYTLSPEKVTVNHALSNLYNRTDRAEGEKGVIILSGEEVAMRKLVERVLSGVFPDFEVQSFPTHADALVKIWGELRERVAMVIANSGIRRDGEGFMAMAQLEEGGGLDLAHVPKVLVSGNSAYCHPDLQNQVAQAIAGGALDAMILKPFAPGDLEKLLARAIANRIRFLDKSEGKDPDGLEAINKVKVAKLERFLNKAFVMAEGWMKTLEPFSRRFDDIDLLLKGLPKIFPLLTSLASNPLMPDAKVRKFLHDINGCFNAMQLIECVFMDMAEGKVDLNASDAHALRNILKECNALHAYSLEVHKAYKGQIPWEDVEDPGVAKPNDMEKLELPRNLRVLLIDDDLTVHRRVKIDFEDDQVGAEVISIKNLAALREVLGAQEKPEIDLILLDHRLNRPFSEQQVWGHELISELREALPGALIVAHTSEAMDLNGDPDNPYANAAGGKVEIAGKHAAKAISGIVRRHLKRGVDKSAAE